MNLQVTKESYSQIHHYVRFLEFLLSLWLHYYFHNYTFLRFPYNHTDT
jgi:hypothetical protein